MIFEWIGGLLAVAGALLVLIAAIGILRFPDVFTRMHAAGLADTLGAALVLVGLALTEGFTTASGRMLLILAFVWLTTPTACHALARNALAAGQEPVLAEPPTTTTTTTTTTSTTGPEPTAAPEREEGDRW
jgi:multicomponent Na+:H+ antiporter subunit G